MVIKGVVSRYQRWNPVHPTFGAFWGMGFGIGCGVGWGPGFGPEVVGYVGAGCGVGFSVGITLAGFGIGLPANYLLQAPYNVMVATGRHVQSSGLISGKESWNNVTQQVSSLQRETSKRLLGFNEKVFSEKGINFFDMQNKLSVCAKSFSKDLGVFSSRFFNSPRGPKD